MFEPLSLRRLGKLKPVIEKIGGVFCLAYQNGIPSAACSYIADAGHSITRITDFCTSPKHHHGARALIDKILTESRSKKITNVQAWMPVDSSTSLDILVEYLFSPSIGRLFMRNTMNERPFSSKINLNLIESSAQGEVTTLPFAEPLSIRALVVGFDGQWQKVSTIEKPESNLSLVVFQSQKRKRHVWLFQRGSRSLEQEFLSSVLDRLYSQGVRAVYAQIDVALDHRIPFEECGFQMLATDFLLEVTLEY